MEQETYLERIKRLKAQQKITNDKLSDMTGIPLGTLSKLLAGISDSPKLSNIVAISRALNCSLDWLITGVPENTHNYTLTPTEISLVETYRMLDSYGQDMTLTVLQKERDRAERQAAEERIRLHDMARYSAKRGSRGRLSGVWTEAAEATAAPGEFYRYAEETSVASGDVSAAEQATPMTLIRGGAQSASPAGEGSAVPQSVLGREGSRVTGLRRRSIGLYELPVSAGVGEFLDDLPVSVGDSRFFSDTTRSEIIIPDDPRTAEADYALRISGDSMEPKYHSGDVILIQTVESVEAGELGVFVLDGAGYFKKFDGDRLLSLNPAYPPILLKDFESAACCGRVVGKLKRK